MKSMAHQFLDFCRSKPADEAYSFISNENCALAQFLKAAGYPVESVGGSFWRDTRDVVHDLPPPLYWSDLGYGVLCECRTFGALADRLEAALSPPREAQAIEHVLQEAAE